MIKKNEILLENTNKKIFFTILLLLTFISGAKCSDDNLDIRNDLRKGFGFLNQCQEYKKSETFANGLCKGLFIGHTKSIEDLISFSQDLKSKFDIDNIKLEIVQNLTYEQKYEIFIKYLKNNPQELHKPINLLMIYAFYKRSSQSD